MTTSHDLYPVESQATDLRVEHDHRIIVGVDGSETSMAALRWAARQARAADARLEVVLVFAPAPAMFFAVGGYPAVSPVDAIAVRKRARALLDEAVDKALGPTADAHLLTIADPSPAKALTRFARGADMLVVGAHQHSGLGLMLGSTATACVRQAACPVVVVPANGHASHRA